MIEPLMLGLSVGLVCLASCGAVLVPWLVVQQRSVAATAWLLAQMLAGRFFGYLLFAAAAWAAGIALVPDDLRTRALVFGVAHLGLAAILFVYVFGQAKASPRQGGEGQAARPACPERAAASRGKRRSPADSAHGDRSRRAGSPGRNPIRYRVARLGPAALGFLTGITLCPPFVVATVRAAELHNLAASLGFFTAFFAGTSLWFLPFLATGAARRLPEARLVARISMGIIAAYYGYLGTVTLGWRLIYG